MTIKRIKKHFHDIVIKTAECFEFYNFNDIIRIEAELNRSVVHLASSTDNITSLCNLATIEKIIDYDQYYRCHKSQIINMNYITMTIERGYNGEKQADQIICLHRMNFN